MTRPAARTGASAPAIAVDDALELPHFGFREIIREPDRILARRGMGRVHHRIPVIVERDPADGRGRRLRLSPKGRVLEEQLSGLQRRAFERAFAGVGDEGACTWAEVMTSLGGGQTAAGLRAAAQRRRAAGARR